MRCAGPKLTIYTDGAVTCCHGLCERKKKQNERPGRTADTHRPASWQYYNSVGQAGRPGLLTWALAGHKRTVACPTLRQNTNRATTWPFRPPVPDVAFMYPKPDCGTPAALTTCVCKGLLADAPGTLMRLNMLKNSPRISRFIFSQMWKILPRAAFSPGMRRERKSL